MKRHGGLSVSFWKDENGGVLIIVAVSMVVLLGMVALAVDVGGLYSARRQMVNAADAAALAGAQELILSSSDHAAAENVARDYAARLNGSDTGQVVVDIPNDYTVHVVTGKNVDYSFARALPGIGTDSDVKAEATAVIGVVDELGGLIPIWMGEEMWDELVAKGEGAQHNYVEFHDNEMPGNWGWVYFDWSEKPSKTAEYLKNGYPNPLPIGYGSDGKSLASNTGANIVNQAGVEETVKDYRDNGTKLYIPVTRELPQYQGKTPLVIVGFAVIKITSYDFSNPSKQTISGQLLANQLIVGHITPGSGDSDYDPKGVALIE